MFKKSCFTILLSISLLKAWGQATNKKQENICYASMSPKQYFDKMLNMPSDYVHFYDTSCVYKLLDTLTTLSIEGNETSLACLAKLYGASDGDVAEYFEVIGTELFYKGFEHVTTYAYETKNKNVEQILIDALSMHVSVSSNRKKELATIDSFVSGQEKQYNFSKSKRIYLDKLVKRINPKKFD
jgi:hypothetical protein